MVPLPVDPEFELLAMVTARPSVKHRTNAIMQSIRDSRIDWWRFVGLVTRHRIAPLAFDGLIHARHSIPDDAYQALRTAALRDRSQALRLVGVLAIVMGLLSAAGIATLSIKGPGLSLLAFGDASMRQCRDLDILIDGEDVARALTILAEADFQLVKPDGIHRSEQLTLWMRLMKDVSLVHVPTGALVELHWRLNENPHLLGDAVRRSRQPVTIGPVGVETLAPRDLLMYLCVHGAEHFWLRLKWLADVHALLADRDPQDITDFYTDARTCDLGVPGGQMLLMLEQVYGLPVPAAARLLATASWRVRAVTCLALRTLRAIGEPGSTRFGTSRLVAGHVLLRGSFRYALREAIGLLIDWPVALYLGRSRWAFVVAIAGRPLFWLIRKGQSWRSA